MAEGTKILSPRIMLLLALIASSALLHVESRFTTRSFGGRHLIEQYADFITTDAAATGTAHGATAGQTGTKWAVLVAGSNGYSNYRHQADICHAYQILKNGGLKAENIIVLMYDDIANAEENPKKGQIINRPGGEDVYKGVPKDYTGNAVTAKNLLAVILGDKNAVKGGNGKVVSSGPNDHIFIFYSDHGSPGLLSMPVGDDLYAKDFIDALKKKHALGTYKSMVLYIEACEAGSIFDGLLPAGMNILATTASNPSESSYATYCPDTDPTVPQEYQTCLGDLYSVSWMEDSDKQNRLKETLEKQYAVVKKRTISAKDYGSHVMMYGDTSISKEMLDVYIGSDLNHGKHHTMEIEIESETSTQQHTPLVAVDQREADILYLRHKVRRAPEGTHQKVEAEKELNEALAHRKHVDRSVLEIGKHLFGAEKGQQLIQTVRPSGQPLVDDWDCLKALAGVYQARCGSLQSYGLKYMRAFANMCNVGIRKEQMDQAATLACTKTTN